MIEPGLWQSKVTVEEMSIPGLPPEYAEKMKQTMAEHRNEASSHCVTAADVKKPKEDFFGADKSCRYEHFTMGGGKIDIAMVCKQEGSTQTTGHGRFLHADQLFDGHVEQGHWGRHAERNDHEDARQFAARRRVHRQTGG